MKCWICGSPADSSEHKIKRKLLVDLFGAGPYHGPHEMLHSIGGQFVPLKGPGAKQMKYENVICARCNSTGTQPFDQAYDLYCRHVIDNADVIIARRVIDFADIFGPQWAQQQANVFKYFAKLFGCHLRSVGRAVPADLWRLLNLEQFVTALRLTFTVNEDKVAMFRSSVGCPVGIGDLGTTERNLHAQDDPRYVWSSYFAYLHVFFWYDWYPTGPVGPSWSADSQYLYLGWMAPLDADQRARFLANLPGGVSTPEAGPTACT